MSRITADPDGTPAERARAAAHWVSPTQIAAGPMVGPRGPDERCRTCSHSYTDTDALPTRRPALRCRDITWNRSSSGGFGWGPSIDTITLATAWCARWDAQLPAPAVDPDLVKRLEAHYASRSPRHD